MLTVSVPTTAAIPPGSSLRPLPPPALAPSSVQFVTLALTSLLLMLVAFQLSAHANKKSAQLRLLAVFSLAAMFLMVGLMAACGGGGGGGGGKVNPRIYTISIQGVSQTFQHLTNAQVVVD